MDRPALPASRRTLLAGAGEAVLAAAFAGSAAARPVMATGAGLQAFPLEAVRLTPSPYLDAVKSNLTYLHRLEPDRLLHNFRKGAGLKPKGAVYGGWESDTIAGHSLGHYLSAVSLMHAQTGDAECRRRAAYIVDELAACQAARGGGYVAGFTRTRGEVTEDGRPLFDELKRGEIDAKPFYLNGCWVPLYNFHKTFAGLLDAHRYCTDHQALTVATGLAGFVDEVFSHLSDAQVQVVLSCEHGGINESLAELYARTADRRWLKLAERIRHRAVLDPLSRGEDDLDGLHANTQIPKLIGLARLHELDGDAGNALAARTFWTSVTGKRSYVIGGNADRESFPHASTISKYITEQTCESCNSYNMLKLTRHLYAWSGDARLFDFYERAHLNHILAQHNPRTGMFAYMVPLMAGSRREWSKPFDDFWCCVGTGMESHAKHGESVWWRRGADRLIVNLFIPSTVTWTERGARFELATRYPYDGRITLRVLEAGDARPLEIALRRPGWATAASITVNGHPVPATKDGGYLVVSRTWRAGDLLELSLPVALRVEPTPDDSSVVAYLHGPMVLAADLGEAEGQWSGPDPALVSADPLGGLRPAGAEPAVYRTTGSGRPGELTLRPFYSAWDRRTAVYFRRFDEAGWRDEQARSAREAAEQARLDARSIDLVRLGDEVSEKSHGLESRISYAVSYRRRTGRDARTGGFFEAVLKGAPGPLVLRASYWGDEKKRDFDILVDGQVAASQRLDENRPGAFFDIDYALPPALTAGKDKLTVRIQPKNGQSAGPLFGLRLLRAQGAIA